MIDVIEYLTPPPGSFWEWRENGEVVTWSDGTTIAFRDEIRTVLEHLAPTGLPSFASLVLLMAATREEWIAAGRGNRILEAVLARAPFFPDRLDSRTEILAGLETVRGLPRELRIPVRAKAALAEAVFRDSPREIAAPTAMAVTEFLRPGLGELLTSRQSYYSHGTGLAAHMLLHGLYALTQGLRRLDADALRFRAETDLDQPPEPVDVEMPVPEAARSLVDSLFGDEEFHGLGRVAKRLFAAASLPRHLSAPPEQQSGGSSDIANRGSLERLLLSELAHDDLTLAVRVAMNEALYVRREMPPATPRVHRAILIDSGIRSWGVPRVFATAAALAFAAVADPKGTVSCYRAKGDKIAKVDLTTRDGLVRHLAALEPDLNPAAAIPAFLSETGPADGILEPILLMTEDALADEAVKRAVREADVPRLFLATVNRDGRFRLLERRPHGTRTVRETTLDLDELFAEPPALIDESKTPDLPAIFGVKPFPLLLPHNIDGDRIWHAEGWGALAVTRDGRLMRWAERGRGAEQLSDGLPKGSLWWVDAGRRNTVMSRNEDGAVHAVASASEPPGPEAAAFVYGTPTRLQLVQALPNGPGVKTVNLPSPSFVRSVCGHNGVLLAFREPRVFTISMTTGEVIEEYQLPSWCHHIHGRFFSGPTGNSLFALAFDGSHTTLEEVPLGDSRDADWPDLISVFEQPGVDGPIAVTADGETVLTATNERYGIPIDFPRPFSVPWVSPDGHWFCVEVQPDSRSSPGKYLVFTSSGEVEVCHGAVIDVRVREVSGGHTLRHRFTKIGINAVGELSLKSRRGQLLHFGIRDGRPLLTKHVQGTRLHFTKPFARLERPEFGYKLSAATWPDGSRAVLDSRGLLHLQSSDRSVPEVTLVLAEGQLTGWCADGGVFGKEYFTAGRHAVTRSADYPNAVFDAAVHGFVERIDA